MSRWPLLTVFSIAWPLAGCGWSLHPGLANVPRTDGLGPADDRIHDVVANGGDSCGLHAEQGPLRGRWPPCPAAAHPSAGALLLPASPGVNESLVRPWLEHFYVGWPCARSTTRTESRTVAWTATEAEPKSCSQR
jgi:hypothetical protein